MKSITRVLEVSAASLDADVVDLQDADELGDAAYITASNIVDLAEGKAHEFEKFFNSYLEYKNPEVVKAMIDATNVDWLFDAEAEEKFDLVVRKIVEGIAFYCAKTKT